MKIINTDKAPAAVGTYSQAVEVNGLFFFSGQIGIDPTTGKIAETMSEQIDQVMRNIDALLEECSLSRKNIVKTSVFLKDLGDFDKVNSAYESFFTTPYPSRSCVEVSRLPKDVLVEIEVIASK